MLRLHLESFEERITPAKFYTVTTTTGNGLNNLLVFDAQGNASSSDGLPISLWQSLRAVATYSSVQPMYPGLNFINFDLPGGGVRTLETPGPNTTDWLGGDQQATLYGYSQPGPSPNTAAFGQSGDAVVLIRFNFRLDTYGSNATVRGISTRGIELRSSTPPPDAAANSAGS